VSVALAFVGLRDDRRLLILRTFILLLAAMLLPVVVALAGDAYARRR
jgi:hypothetical protein